ncbi:MAG: MarR family winged helix-turn-helix transcriptional regulator [Leucothrix sp.]
MDKKLKRKAEIGVSTIEADIFNSTVRHSDKTLAAMNQLLSIWGMTVLQHAALRVIYIYDTEGTGIPSGEIGKHLVTRVPDMTRLLDRMADKGWLVRERDAANRRIVRARLTEIGIELVESAHSSLAALEKEQLEHMSVVDKRELKRLLALAALGKTGE